jgi:hypothetical protein
VQTEVSWEGEVSPWPIITFWDLLLSVLQTSKIKCIHKYTYDLIYINVHMYMCRERENMFVLVGLSDRTTRRQERERE